MKRNLFRLSRYFLALLFVLHLPSISKASHTMNWNIVDITQTGTATGGIDVMVTLGFCNGWCTGTNITCCGGLHDVYIRITQVSGDCAACPTGGVPTIIGPIDAGFVGPPYNATNPVLPACPANLGDPGNVEIPFSFEGCPGEEYMVEVLAINRTTLNNCGGIGAIPNACTSGCAFSTFTDWLPAVSVNSPGGVFTIPGLPVAPVLSLSTDDDVQVLACGDAAGEFLIDYDVVACRDIPGTQLENTWTILSGPDCITIGSTPPNPTPCTASTDAPFAGTFGLAFPAYPDGCSAMDAPCGGPGTYPITVRMETTDLCTGEMTFQDITVTLEVAGNAAQCFDYEDLCEDEATTIPYTGPDQPPGSFSMVPAGPATIDPATGEINVAALACGGPEVQYVITYTPDDPNACTAMDDFSYVPPPCVATPIVGANMCIGDPIPAISAVCSGPCGDGSPIMTEWYNLPTGGALQGTGTSFTPIDGVSLSGIEVFDASEPGTYVFFAACVCNGCAAERVGVELTINETNAIPNVIDIGGQCKPIDVANASSLFNLSDLFPGATGDGVLSAVVATPYTTAASISAIGNETLIQTGGGCFEVIYEVPDVCTMGEPNMQSAFVQCGIQPEPFFTIMSKACYTPGSTVSMVPFETITDYDLANPGFENKTWTVLSGPGTIIDPITGELSVTGAGTILLELEICLEFPACGPFPALECCDSYVAEIIVTDGEALDASFTKDNESACIGDEIIFTAVTPGGLFEGVGVVDNGDGTASLSITECGTTAVTYNIQNGACVNSYTLLCETDMELPMLTPAFTDGEECGAEDLTAWLATASAMDNCDVTLESNLINTISGCGGTQTFVYEFVATDPCGNVSSEIQSYIVTDFTPPTITAAAPLVVECNSGSANTEIDAWIANNGGATATDLCGDFSWSFEYLGAGVLVPDCSDNTGSVDVEFTATDDCGNSVSTVGTITIEDTIEPEIYCPEDLVLECGDPNNASIIDIWLATTYAVDQCDFDLTIENDYADGAAVCEGDAATIVTFTTEDACGNTAMCTATIIVQDTQLPLILMKPQDMTVECDGAGNTAALMAWLATNGGAMVVDDCDDDLDLVQTMTGDNPGCSSSDVLNYEFRWADDCDNEVEAFANFIIEDTTPPDLTLPADMTVECDGAGNIGDIMAFEMGGMAMDLCDAAPIVESQVFNTISACGGGNITTYRFTAVDACGNLSDGYASITIVDAAVPTITCPADLVLECGDPDNDLAIITWLNTAVTTDVCSDVVVTNNFNGALPALSCGGATGTTVVFTATDACGLTATCTADIILDDTTPPSFINCPADITVNSDVANCGSEIIYSTPIAEDNCDVTVSFTSGIESGETFPVGTTDIVFTAVDACMNAVTCEFSITVEDTTDPTISCPGNIVVCNDATTCTWASDASTNSTSSENCMGVVTHTIVSADGSIDVVDAAGDVPAGTLFPLGSSTITYTIEDAFGNMVSCSFDVIVSDCEDPIIVCPMDMVVECDGAGNTAELAAWITTSLASIEANSTDNCDMILVAAEQEFNTISGCGESNTTVYQFTVSDDAGNSSVCTASFIIEDNIPPNIIAEAVPIEEHCEVGEFEFIEWLLNNGGAEAEDDCGSVTWTNDFVSGFDDTCDETVEVTFTATDACGNTATTVATYRIHDDESPMILPPANITLECNDPANDAIVATWLNTYQASDNCHLVTVQNDFVALPTTCVVPNNEITVMFMAEDECGNFGLTQATITIEDTTAPAITINAQDLVLECADPGNAALIEAWETANGLAIATDQCATDLTWTFVAGTPVPTCGMNTITEYTFTVEDECGNTTETIAQVILEDTTPPTLTVPANQTEECGAIALTVTEWLALAMVEDDCDALPVISTELWNTISGCGGTYTETYLFTATDDCGNQTTGLADYVIEDTGLPTIMSCPVPLVLECGVEANDQIILQWLESAVASDENSCSEVTITHDYPGGLPGACGSPVISVTFTATDACGNEVSCMSTIEMMDTQLPVWLNCPTDMTVNVDVDLCETNVVYSTPIAFDACDDALVITPAAANIPSGMPFPLGTTSLSFTATDACGNVSAVCSFDITVEDSDIPSIDCPSNAIVVCNADGSCAWPSDASINSLTADNCTGSMFVHDIVSADGSIDVVAASGNVPAGTLFPLGTSTVTYTITDAAGNVASCSFDVLVEDCEDPVITCSDELAIACGAEDLAGWIATISATVTDNCDDLADLVVTSQLITDFSSCGGTFNQVYEFTVTDQAGNTGICLATYMTTDDVPPVIDPIAMDMTVECDGDEGAALLAWLANNGGASATDACSEPVVWTNNYAGQFDAECGGTGSSTVIFTATDACGNMSTTEASFIIEDTTDPDLVCPDDLVLECADPMNDMLIASWLGTGVVFDDCSGAISYTTDYPDVFAPSCGAAGVFTVTFTLVDACLNETTCVRTITLEDNTAPTIDLDASDIVLECADPGNDAAIAAWLASNGGAIASDACSVINPLTDWSNDGGVVVSACGETSTTTYVFTVLDDCMNASTTSASIILIDTTAPDLNPPSDIVEECGDVGIDVAAWIAMATAPDDCDAAPVIDAVLWNTISGCGGTNTEVYLFTATDACGNQSTEFASYTLEDTGIPTIVCPPPLVLECANPDNDQLILQWLDAATATDAFDCSAITITHDYPGGLPDNCGAPGINVNFTATDACGNEISCMSTISMIDTQVPVWLNCPEDMTVNVDVDLCETNVVYSTPIAVDACDDALTIIPGATNIPSGMPFPLGTTTISYTATDACGNVSAVCSFDITVVDSDTPSIDCPSNAVVVCNTTGSCTWPSDASINSLTADNCVGSSFVHDIVSADGSIDVVGASGNVPAGTLFPLGTSTVSYTITDAAGNTASCSFDVVVEDCEDPVILCTDELEVACGAEDLATWMADIAATATDNCDELADLTVTNQLLTDFSSCGGTFEQVYLFTVTDQAGNTGTCLATYMTVDEVPPLITDAIDETVECNGGSQSTALLAWLNNNGGATATDDCSEPLVWTNDFTGDLIPNCTDGVTGSVTVTFTATDACGNSSETAAVFEIVDTTSPDLSCPDNLELECSAGINDIVINNWLNSAQAIDECDGTVAVTNDFDDVFAPACGLSGVYTVTFTTEDACGNLRTCTRTITLVDTTPPTIDLPAEDLVLECADPGNAAAIAAWLANNGGAVASDDCSLINPLTAWSNDGGTVVPGCGANSNTTYVFTVLDDCMNASTTTASIILEDTTPPMLFPPDDIVEECGNIMTDVAAWILMASATDDCGAAPTIDAVLWNTISGCGGTNTEVYLFTATDDCGNETTGFANYTITDTGLPSIVCPPTLELECADPDNDQLILAWLESATATDEFDCSAVTITHDYPGGLPDNCGAAGIDVIFTATDDCGNEISCTATIMMDDTTIPVWLNCPEDMTVNVDVDLCETNVVYSTPIAFDSCDDNLTITPGADNIPSGMPFPIGTTTISYTATDACGNVSAVCSFDITVVDSDIPSIDCPSNTVVVCNADGTCTWPSDASINSLTADNCPGSTFTHDIVSADGSIDVVGAMGNVPAGTLFPLGISTVTYTIVDAAGNSATCSFNVLVEDCEDPVITCSDELDVACGTEDVAAWMAAIAATVTDNCDDLVDLVVSNQLVTDFSSCGGTFEQTYLFTVTDQAGNTGTCLASYSTIDEVAPVIAPMAMDMVVECDGNENEALLSWLANNGGAMATDACSEPVIWTNDYVGVFTADCGGTGTTTVTFTATDACGNSSETVATFTIEDSTAPELSCPDDIVLECGDPVNDAVITNWLGNGIAFDECSGQLTYTTDYPDVFTPSCGGAGVFTVTFTLVDECLNTTTCVRTISIEDNTVPVIETPAQDLVLECADPGNAAAIAAWELANGGAVASDICSEPIDWTFAADTAIPTCGLASITSYTFTATDACGNQSTTIARVIIEDNIAPELTVPEDLIEECAAEMITLDDWLDQASAMDDCGDVTITNRLFNTISGCGGTETLVYEFTAVDACGNESSDIAEYVTVDNTDPVIVTPAMPFVGECNGSSNAIDLISWLNSNGGAEAEDTCGDITWTNDYGTIVTDCGTTGEVVVTFTATDDCGNSTSTSTTFEINDDVAPFWEIEPQDLTIICDGNVDPLGAIDAWLNTVGGGEAEDSCSLIIYTNDFTGLTGGCSALTGSALVTFTATDACGNAASLSATVEIIDNQAPTIVSPAKDTIVECNPATVTMDSLSWIANNGGALAEDLCSGVEIWTHTLMDVVDGCGPTATYRYMFTAIDSCGNESVVTIANFIVEDTTPPLIDPMAMDMVVECDGAGNDGEIDAWLANIAAAGATDICSGTNLTWEWDLIMDEDSCGITGIQVYRFTVEDECGNTSTTEGSFTIEDTVAPEIVGGEDVSGECDQSGAGNDDELISWLSNNANADATDVCGGVTWTNNFDVDNWVDGCNDSRSIEVIFTATDDCGNASSITHTFSTGDLTPPEFLNCPAGPIVVDAPVGWCTAFVNYPDLIATDNCGDAEISQIDGTGLTSGSLFPVGLTILSFQAIDDCGNVSFCEIKIIVNDFHTPPTIVCPQDTIVPNTPDMCGAVVNDLAPISFEDNCPDNIVVTYEVKDAAGNIVACGFDDASGIKFPEGVSTICYTIFDQPLVLITEIVQDGGVTGVEITNFGPASVDLSCLDISREGPDNESYNIPNGTIVPVGGVYTQLFTNVPAGTPAGYYLDFAGNGIDGVAINGHIPVNFTFAGSISGVNIYRDIVCDHDDAADWVVAAGCTAGSFGLLNPGLPVLADNGSTVGLQAEAPSSAVCTTTVTVIDEEVPFCAEHDTTSYMVTLPIVVAPDACTSVVFPVTNLDPVGDININDLIMSIANAGDISMALTSPSGTTVNLFGGVCPNTADIDISLDDSSVNNFGSILCGPLGGGTDFQALGSFKDFFGENPSGDWILEIANSGAVPGMLTSVELEVLALAPYSVGDICIDNDPGECGAEFSWIPPIAADNCCLATISVEYSTLDDISTPPSGSVMSGVTITEVFEVGTTTVTYTLMDQFGNTSTCSFDVEVKDTEDPVIDPLSCMDQVIDLEPGECTFPLNSLNLPVTEDNCGVESIVYDPAFSDGIPTGVHVITVTVTDLAGNVTSCMFTVTINGFEPDSNQLACNDQINVSLGSDCMACITPDMLLEGDQYGCFDDFCVTLMTLTGIEIGNSTDGTNCVGLEYVDQIIRANVCTDCEDGNCCWVDILIETKALPEVICPADTVINCNHAFDPSNTGEPIVTSCEEDIFINYVDDFTNLGMCLDTTAQIVRTWSVTDEAGNWVECVQVITIKDFDNTDIVWPDNIILTEDYGCQDIIDNPELTHPDETGYPLIGGVPVFETGDGLCSHFWNWDDQLLMNCEGSYEILRKWIIRDMCEEIVPGVNPIEHYQSVKVLDDVPPVIKDCPDDITISTDPWACYATVHLNDYMPILEDYCGSIQDTFINVTKGTLFEDPPGSGQYYATHLNKGDHTVKIIVKDQCSNYSECSFDITVLDLVSPNVVCTGNIVLSLSTTGLGKMFAESVDAGSFDACTNIQTQIFREDAPCGFPEDTEPGEFVHFCCEDIENSPILVGMIVWDDADMNGEFGTIGDNYSECWVEVTVEDKFVPQIGCPADVTITCDMDYTNLLLTGAPTLTTACDLADATYEDDLSNFDDCGNGIIYRVWTIEGQEAPCVQTITVTAFDIFTGDDIVWPLDYEGDCLETVPDDQPFFTNSSCSMVGINVESDTFFFESDACYKVVNEWTVIDWCQYDSNDPDSGGIWTSNQTIAIVDESGPQIQECALVEVGNLNADCILETLLVSNSATDDNCGFGPALTWFYQIDIGKDGTVDQAGEFEGDAPSIAVNNVPKGYVEVTWVVRDGCGNASTCTQEYHVFDGTPPVPYCNEISTSLGQTGTVEVWASDFDLGAEDNCDDQSQLSFSFTEDGNTPNMEFDCDDIPNGIAAAIELDIWVFDASGNGTFCTTTMILTDSGDVCTDDATATAAVLGRVHTEEEEGVNHVNVILENQLVDETFNTSTDSTGVFTYPSEMPISFDYSVTPSRNDDPLNGVTTLDILLMQRHVLGLDILDSPYKIIAGDVNNSESLSGIDIVELRKLILGHYAELPDNTSWRFASTDFIFTNPQEPWPFDELRMIEPLVMDMNQEDFIGIKVGDVNSSSNPSMLTGNELSDVRTEDALTIQVDDISMTAGEEYDVDIYIYDTRPIVAFQGGLKFDPTQVEILSVDGLAMDMDATHFGPTAFLEKGIINFSWSDPYNNGLSLTDKITIRLKANVSTQISDILSMDNEKTPIVAYYQDGSELKDEKIELSIADRKSKEFIVYQNTPNPFTTSSVIQIDMPENGELSFRILDALGKKLIQQTKTFHAGENIIELDKNMFPSGGVYIYEIDYKDYQTQVFKMIVVK